ncbi:MAG: hypothetical protein ACD_21C00052G0009 [uncultured bacterium]|nr:MAG: hypothetical protein ACD_21C00052G0009 [uncultured bacterium]
MRKIFIGIICSLCITVSAFAAPAYGPTTANDTLWRIAIQLRPSSEVSVQQVMLAILGHNMSAFYCNNVNALEPGKKIKLPSVDEISSISKNKAYLEVEKQNKQWKRLSKKHSIKQKRSAKIARYKKAISVKSKQQSIVALTPLQSVDEKIQPAADQQEAQSTVQSVMPQPDVVNPSLVPVPQPEATALPVVAMSAVTPQEPAATSNASQEEPLLVDINNRLVLMETKNEAIQSQVVRLGERVSSIEQNVGQLQKQSLENKSNFFKKLSPFFRPIQKHLSQPLFIFLISCVVVLLFLVVIYLVFRRRSQDVFNYPASHTVHDSDKEEYNLIEGKEGSAARLNLARAYIDMGKESEAQTILFDVLAKGSPSEKAEAKELLERAVK